MDEEKKIGVCRFCGQSMMVETLGDVSQEERDLMATDMCHCPEAEADRRRRDREEKIDAYVDKHFSKQQKPFVLDCIEQVKTWDSGIDEVTIKSGCKQTKIWVDDNEYIRLRTKATEDDELKV